MTLQQLEYVLAVDQYRHFGRAAESCGITQSTLSTMIHKLEEELDVLIFDRAAQPLQPTSVGREIITHARATLQSARQLREATLNERQRSSGTIRIAFSPTVASHIVPRMINIMNQYPEVEVHACEQQRDKVVEQLLNGQLDVGVMALGHHVDHLLEIPLYRERILLYVSPIDPLHGQEEVDLQQLPYDRLWAIHNEYSFASEVCDANAFRYARVPRYSSGNVPTLLHIVNHNDGFTLIPELHVPLLRPEDKQNVRPLVNPEVYRQVSLFVREDYVREGLLNVLADVIKQIIPPSMIDPHLAKFPIRLR